MAVQAENIIWQYWETRGAKPKYIDGLFDIAKRNSGVEIILVTPETLQEYLSDIEEDVLRIETLAHKADMIRTRLIWRYGGMWLDSDAVVLSDLNWLFEYLVDYEFVGFNNEGRLQSERPWVRVNCFLSRPGGRVVGEWVRVQRKRLPKLKFEWSEIGAEALNPVCLANREIVKILPFERICPVPWNEVQKFTVRNTPLAESILQECFAVMITNRAIELWHPHLQQLTVEDIAGTDCLLGSILRGAIAAGGSTEIDWAGRISGSANSCQNPPNS